MGYSSVLQSELSQAGIQCASEDVLLDMGYFTEHAIGSGTEAAEAAFERGACYSSAVHFETRLGLVEISYILRDVPSAAG